MDMLKKPIILILIMLIATSLCVFTAYAETEPQEETYAIESFATEASDNTEAVGDEPSSDTEAEATDAVETENTDVSTTAKPVVTYREPLPEISSEDIVIPPAIGEAKEENEPSLFWGFIAWICVGVGFAVILAVLLTTKTKAYRGGGKKRYSTGDKISGKKRLLNDKYYNNKRR